MFLSWLAIFCWRSRCLRKLLLDFMLRIIFGGLGFFGDLS